MLPYHNTGSTARKINRLMTLTRTRVPWWRKILKIVAWTVMAAILTVVATVICTVNLLDPPHLTPLTEHVANRMLDAEAKHVVDAWLKSVLNS